MVKEEKSRYIAFEIIIEDDTPLEVISVFNSISRSILSLYGEVEASQSGIWLMEFDAETCNGILRCTSKSLDKVQTAMAIISSIDNKPAIIRLLKTSGTIRSLRSSLEQPTLPSENVQN